MVLTGIDPEAVLMIGLPVAVIGGMSIPSHVPDALIESLCVGISTVTVLTVLVSMICPLAVDPENMTPLAVDPLRYTLPDVVIGDAIL